MEELFSLKTTKDLITNYLQLLIKISPSNEFEKTRNGYIHFILDLMVKHPQDWDESTQFNISTISKSFTRSLNLPSLEIKEDDSLDMMFILLFRFFNEYQLYKMTDEFDNYSRIRDFARKNFAAFSTEYAEQIDYTLRDMPVSIIKSLLSGNDFSSLRDFSALKKEAEQFRSAWDADLKARKKEVDDLKESLDSYKDAFNFVGIYNGFKSIGEAKDNELKTAKYFLLVIGAIIPVVIGLGLWHMMNLKEHIQSLFELVTFIPATALSIVLIYYFRISLSNYNSIRAQKMQIELRKSLCQFIQQYSKYSSEISKDNAGLLSKFEDVIFSNIMTSEDKMPSTFDGLEQIATLIKAVKTKSS